MNKSFDPFFMHNYLELGDLHKKATLHFNTNGVLI